jgi:RHS repeat-associated protein
MTDASGTTSYAYDATFGTHITSKTTPFGVVRYGYDGGLRLQRLYSSTQFGESVYYDYDGAGRLAHANTSDGTYGLTYTFGYDNAGSLTSTSYPNGVVNTYTYDNLNRLTNLTSGKSGVSPLASYTYALGAAGNRTSVTELNGRTSSYTYDDLYRLTSETISKTGTAGTFTCGTTQCGTIGYVYDEVGNRKLMTSTLGAVPAGTFYYDANDRFTTDTYDNNGNTTASAGIGNVYDFENHLIKHGNVTMVYDGDGNRVKKVVGATTYTYLYDDAINPTGYVQLLEESANGQILNTYEYGPMRLGVLRSSQHVCGFGCVMPHNYYGYDGHGSVRYLTDPSGVVKDTYDYDAYGNLVASTGTDQNLFLFAGEQYDSDLGLYYNRARYLDVRVGRFWGMDTAFGSQFSPSSLHRFSFASDNPVNRWDPTGNFDLVDMQIATSVAIGLDAAESLVGHTLFWGMLGCLEDSRHDCEDSVQTQLSLSLYELVRTPTVGERDLFVGEFYTNVNGWTLVNRAFPSEASENYQAQVSGKPGYEYLHRGVLFDGGGDSRGLRDAKYRYGKFVNPETGEFYDWWGGKNGLRSEMRAQVEAAGADPVTWYSSDRTAIGAFQEIAEESGYSGRIRFQYEPAIEFIPEE